RLRSGLRCSIAGVTIVVVYRRRLETCPFRCLLICTPVTDGRRLLICTSITLVRLLFRTPITLVRRLLICTSITLLRRLLACIGITRLLTCTPSTRIRGLPDLHQPSLRHCGREPSPSRG